MTSTDNPQAMTSERKVASANLLSSLPGLPGVAATNLGAAFSFSFVEDSSEAGVELFTTIFRRADMAEPYQMIVKRMLREAAVGSWLLAVGHWLKPFAADCAERQKNSPLMTLINTDFITVDDG